MAAGVVGAVGGECPNSHSRKSSLEKTKQANLVSSKLDSLEQLFLQKNCSN